MQQILVFPSAYKYYYGDNYTKTASSTDIGAVSPKIFTDFYGSSLRGWENETNNICSETNLGQDHRGFSCFERDPMFAFITLFFIYLPSSQVMRAVYGREAAGVITFLWGVVFLLTGLVLWPVFATGSSTGAMFSVGLVAFGMFTGVFGLTADPSYSAWKTLLRSSKFWRTFLTFPLILVISPWLIVLIKLRTILPYNIQVLRQKQVLALGESALEAAPQLAFQLYIVTTRSDRHDGVLYVLPRNHHLSAIARFPCLSPKLLKLLFSPRNYYKIHPYCQVAELLSVVGNDGLITLLGFPSY